jgi:hypothetical protein
MLVGYNTNISYKEHVYHVQTEDSGQSNPVIVSLIYFQGAIIASRKTNYAHVAHDPDFKEKVTRLMKAQHKWMIRELLAGKFTGDYQKPVEAVPPVEEAQAGEEAKPLEELHENENTGEITASDEQLASPQGEEQPPSPQAKDGNSKNQLSKSLDDILLNYIMKRDKK